MSSLAPLGGVGPRPWRHAGLLLGVGLGIGCSRATDAPVPGATAAEAGQGEALALATPTAFDLTAAPGGALLAWAGQGGRLHVTAFDADGKQGARGRQADETLHEPADLALVATVSGAALAWTEPTTGGARAQAAWLDADGSLRRFELGPAFRVAPSARGGLGLGTSGSEALVLVRGAEAHCDEAAAGVCSAFQFFRVSAEGARPTGLPLMVPSPCAEQAALLGSAPAREGSDGVQGRLDYAVCSSAHAAPALTVFSIQPSPAYAMAEDVFAGCSPLGAGRFAGETAFIASCNGQRRMATVPGGGESLRVRDLDQRGLVCRAGGARLRLGNTWLGLDEPLGRLELLLDEDLAPPGARAVWTGSTLVVARANEKGQLALARHGCRDGALLELDGDWDAGR